jgi:hypothetical protein
MELMIILEVATLLVMFCRGWYNASSLLCAMHSSADEFELTAL